MCGGGGGGGGGGAGNEGTYHDVSACFLVWELGALGVG